MAYPDIPTVLRTHLAARTMREHHHLWHLARRPGALPPNLAAWERQALAKPEWKAPRRQGQPTAGIDFLGMHRSMIAIVNGILATAGNASWPRVIGWNPIPFSATDSNWPMPVVWPAAPNSIAQAKTAQSAQRQRQMVQQGYRNAAALRTVGVDQLGSAIENDIHNWMHLRWAARPSLGAESVDPRNDYLAAPWSSHVNPVFWKLHGWIDDCIRAWEAANNATADLSHAWSGPAHGDGGVHHHGPEAMAPAELADRKPTLKSINWFPVRSSAKIFGIGTKTKAVAKKAASKKARKKSR